MPREIRLEVRRLIRQECVCRRVRLVETIACEMLHQLEDVRRLLLVVPLLLRAVDKLAAHLGHDVRVLLPHCLAQQVGLAKREAGQHV